MDGLMGPSLSAWRVLTPIGIKSTQYYNALATDPHPDTAGHAVIGSLAENLFFNRYDYMVSDSGTATGPATYRQPITLAGLNAASAIPPGQAGRSVFIMAPSSTVFTTPAAGAAGKILTLRNARNLTAGYVTNQNYWLVAPNGGGFWGF